MTPGNLSEIRDWEAGWSWERPVECQELAQRVRELTNCPRRLLGRGATDIEERVATLAARMGELLEGQLVETVERQQS